MVFSLYLLLWPILSLSIAPVRPVLWPCQLCIFGMRAWTGFERLLLAQSSLQALSKAVFKWVELDWSCFDSHSRMCGKKKWWALPDSNWGPADYESGALFV